MNTFLEILRLETEKAQQRIAEEVAEARRGAVQTLVKELLQSVMDAARGHGKSRHCCFIDNNRKFGDLLTDYKWLCIDEAIVNEVVSKLNTEYGLKASFTKPGNYLIVLEWGKEVEEG